MDNINDPENSEPVRVEPLDDFSTQKNLPNSTAVLVLGICSIPTCLCYGFPGFLCALIALILSSVDTKAYRKNPNAYTRSSYGNLNAGRICAIIGLSLSSIVILWFLIWMVIAGTIALSTAPWNLMSK
jgi:hypothetical protein